MKKTKILIYFLMGPTLILAQTPKEQIEAAIDQVMAQENIPAMSLALIQEDKPLTYINRGYLSRNGGDPVSEQSLYQIGSLGKMFIGIIAHHLILDGKLVPERSILAYLPGVYSEKTKQKLQSVTIKQVLHHRSGLPRNPKVRYKRKDGEPYLYAYTEDDFRAELEKARLKNQEVAFQYSNLGYGLLAYILEEVSQLTFAELLERYICQPYTLENTGLTPHSSQLVIPYRKDDRMQETKPWLMGKMAPPSALYSSPQDLARLMTHHLEAYQQFESSAKLSALILSQDKRALGKNASVSYGYGFFIGQNGMVGHGGDLDGYGCEYTFSIPEGYGLVLLTSSGGKWIPSLLQKIQGILAP